MSEKRGRGAPPVARHEGDLRPVYQLLQRKLPGHPASRGWKTLAAKMTDILHPNPGSPEIKLTNLMRDLGGERIGGKHYIKRRYYEAFKQVYVLAGFGIGDDILLSPDPQRVLAAIEAALDRQPFDVLRLQRDPGNGAAIAMIPAPATPVQNELLGPNRTRFQVQPLGASDGIPVGFLFRYAVTLPWPGYVTILSRDPDLVRIAGTPSRPVFALDDQAGCAGPQLPTGTTELPGLMEMCPPAGCTTTLAICAREPFQRTWDPKAPVPVSPEALSRFVTDLVTRGRDRFAAAVLDYIVVDTPPHPTNTPRN
jgi:hypothetical protein